MNNDTMTLIAGYVINIENQLDRHIELHRDVYLSIQAFYYI